MVWRDQSLTFWAKYQKLPKEHYQKKKKIHSHSRIMFCAAFLKMELEQDGPTLNWVLC